MFAFVENTHAVPAFTAVLSGKTKPIYRQMWEILHDALDATDSNNDEGLNWTQANFDCEVAAVKSFSESFQGKTFMIISRFRRGVTHLPHPQQTITHNSIYIRCTSKALCFPRETRRKQIHSKERVDGLIQNSS